MGEFTSMRHTLAAGSPHDHAPLCAFRAQFDPMLDAPYVRRGASKGGHPSSANGT